MQLKHHHQTPALSSSLFPVNHKVIHQSPSQSLTAYETAPPRQTLINHKVNQALAETLEQDESLSLRLHVLLIYGLSSPENSHAGVHFCSTKTSVHLVLLPEPPERVMSQDEKREVNARKGDEEAGIFIPSLAIRLISWHRPPEHMIGRKGTRGKWKVIPKWKRDTRASELAQMQGMARKAGDCTEGSVILFPVLVCGT